MAKQPADAAADAIDAVRAVADVSVHAVVDAGPTPGHFDKLLRYHHIPHSVSRCFS